MKRQISEYLAIIEKKTGMTHFLFSSQQDATSFAEASASESMTMIAKDTNGKAIALHRVSIPSDTVEDVMKNVEVTGFPRTMLHQDSLDISSLSHAVALMSAAQQCTDEIYR